MKKIATFLVIVGLVMFAAVMFEYKWDFTKLSTEKYETNTHEISEEFKELLINVDTVDIMFVLSNDGICRVECYEEEKAKHSVTVEESTLVIKEIDTKSWYDNIGLHFGSPKITVYLPETEYTSLSLKTSTGDICIENVSVEVLHLSTSTGDIKLKHIKCKNLTSDGSTGDIYLGDVVATEKFWVGRSTGDVRFDKSDAPEILVEISTGDVTGTLLSGKDFITKTSTGTIDVPKKTSGGKCEITTSTGDIIIDVVHDIFL